MKRNEFTKLRIISILFCSIILCVSFLCTKNDKSIILKSNIEAISDSGNNDPGVPIYLNRCFAEVKYSSSADAAYLCSDGTTLFNYNDRPGLFSTFEYDYPEYDVLPCVREPEAYQKPKTKWGYCYKL